MNNFIFVYGSLKVGFINSFEFDKDRILMIPAKIKGKMYDIGGFPGVITGNSTIYGELHLYKDIENVLERMDFIESFSLENSETSFYIRKLVNVRIYDYCIKAWCYFLNEELIFNDDFLKEIKSGKWNENYY